MFCWELHIVYIKDIFCEDKRKLKQKVFVKHYAPRSYEIHGTMVEFAR